MEFAKYDRFLSEQLAYFFGRLSEFKDKTGTVLDNSIVLYGSGASTTHNPRNLPTMVVGGSNMGLKHGLYHQDGTTKMSNMFLSILHSMGIEQNRFSDSSGTALGTLFSKV